MSNAPYPARLAVSPTEQLEFNNLSVRNLADIFLRHRMLILATVVLVTGLAAIAQLLIQSPQYVARSTTKIEFAAEGARASPISVPEQDVRMETQTKLMGSPSLAEMVVRDLKLYDEPRFTGHHLPRGLTHEQLQTRISISTRKLLAVTEIKRQPKTQLIEVAVATEDPALSARVADRFPLALQRWQEQTRTNDRRDKIATLQNKVQTLSGQLAGAEQAVADFRIRNRMLVGAGTVVDLAQLNNIAAEAASAQANRAGAYARASGVRTAGLGGEAYSSSSPQLIQEQHQFDELNRRKAELSVTYGPGYPEVQAINAQLRQVQSDMAKEAERAHQAAITVAQADVARAAGLARSEADGAAARSAVLSGVVGNLAAQAYRNTQASGTLAKLERDAQNLRDLYADARQMLAGQIASPDDTSVTATALAPAPIPTDSVNVTPAKKVTVAFFGSMLLGFLVAFAWDMLDTRLRSASEIRRRFALPTLGMFPAVDPALLADPANNPVIAHPRSLFAEAARTLYLETTRKPVAGGGKIVAITSPLPGDGKSTIALSLAAAAMKLGARVILVDLDLRQSSVLQEIQRISGGPDLIHYISNRDSVHELIPNMSDPLRASAHLIDAGGAAIHDPQMPSILSTHDRVDDPGAIISSGALHDLLRRLRTQFDLVVINAPPVLAVRDASTLSSIANETLMVLRWGETTTEELSAAIAAMGDVPMGVVFNNVNYAEHARRRHSDAIQYLSRAASYYDKDDADLLRPPGLIARLRRLLLARRPAATAC